MSTNGTKFKSNREIIGWSLKAATLVGLSGMLMGNQSCNQAAAPARVLARRVQLGQVTAPAITLPATVSNSQFNFQYVANQQMLTVLSATKTFSTANIDPNAVYTPAGLDADISNDFNNCTSSTDTTMAPTFIPAGRSASGMNEVMTNSNSCVINMPQAIVNGSINDFTLVGGGGLSLSLANVALLPSANFSFQSYSLQVEMSAKFPLDPGNNAFASQTTNTSGYGGSLSATLNFGALSLGPSAYYQTPLSTITMNGLTSATTDLANQWSSQDPWYASVLKACGTFIYINGSSDLGLKVGDIVAIKNVTYEWNGTPCDSQSLGNVPDVNPVEYAQIVSLGDNLSVAQILKGNSAYPQGNSSVYAGARVYMYQTAESVKSAQAAKGASGGVCQLPVGTCGGSATATTSTTTASSQ